MTKLKIEFTQDQLQVLNSAVCELPYRVAAPLIQHINAEIQRQLDAAVDAHDMPSGATKQPDPYTGD